MSKLLTDIYTAYNILPNLAVHQLRVASVAMTMLRAMGTEDDAVISACLLHDMGNIIKFRLTDFPEFLEPQGIAYWTAIKKRMIETYGNDEHSATIAIAKEIGVSSYTMGCLEAVGFSHSIKNLEAPLSHQMCAYADMRVGPHGILSLTERFADGKRRYADRVDRERILPSNLEELYSAAFSLEHAIFTHLPFSPKDITDREIAKYMEGLREWKIT